MVETEEVHRGISSGYGECELRLLEESLETNVEMGR